MTESELNSFDRNMLLNIAQEEFPVVYNFFLMKNNPAEKVQLEKVINIVKKKSARRGIKAEMKIRQRVLLRKLHSMYRTM